MQYSSRLSNVLYGSIGSFVSRVSIHAIQVFFIGYFSRVFSLGLFGVWSLLQQTIIFSSLVDFGLAGGSFRNKISSLHAFKKFNQEKSDIFSSVFSISLVLYVTCSLLSLFLFKYFGLGWLLKFDFGVVPKKYLQIFTISYILILFRSLFSIYHSVLYASQKTHYKCFLEAVSYFVLFLLILLCKNLEITSEKLFVLYFFYLFILEFVCFLTFIKISKIQLYLVSFSRIKSYLQELGVQSFFFWLQNLASLFLFSSLIYLVNLTTGTEAAGEFALVSRPFLLILGIHFMFLNPFWSALSDALYKKEFCWIRSIFWKGLFLSILLPVFACVFLQIFYKGLLLRWSGRFFENDLLIALLSLWTILYCVINYLSIYLNALSKINTQVLFLGVGALLLLFLGPFLGAKCSASGVVLVGILAALPLFFSNIKQVKKLILKNEKGFNR